MIARAGIQVLIIQLPNLVFDLRRDILILELVQD
jgi:hypothetical protein